LFSLPKNNTRTSSFGSTVKKDIKRGGTKNKKIVPQIERKTSLDDQLYQK
jgi:hypothetical protein